MSEELTPRSLSFYGPLTLVNASGDESRKRIDEAIKSYRARLAKAAKRAKAANDNDGQRPRPGRRTARS